MGWSSRDNNLRRNRKPVPVPVNIAPKTPVNKIAAQPVSTDLSILDERSAKNVATLHDKVQEIFRNWIAECQVLAKAHDIELKENAGITEYLDKHGNLLFYIDHQHLVYFGILNGWRRDGKDIDSIWDKAKNPVK